jgi:hypothetical protein
MNTMHHSRRLISLALLLAGTGSAVMAAPAIPDDVAAERQFSYFLHRTVVDVVVTQRLDSCPAGDTAPGITTNITISPRPVPDPAGQVTIDARNNLFSRRTTSLDLNPDGTLAGFSAATEGQGGAVIASVLKAAASVVTMLGAAPPQQPVQAQGQSPALFKCTDAAAVLLARLDKASTDIATLEAAILEGNASAAQSQLLERRRALKTKLQAALTLSASGSIDPGAAIANTSIAPVAFDKWLDPSNAGLQSDLARNNIVGRHGFQISVIADASLLSVLKDGDLKAIPPSTPYLIYRRPVPATVTVAACLDDAKSSCTIDETPDAKDVAQQADAALPQLSGFYAIRIGRGGLFGNRQAIAKFDAFGSPTHLEYSSESGGDAIAGVVDAGAAAAGTLHDAQLNGLKRQIDLIEARKKLADLLAPASDD